MKKLKKILFFIFEPFKSLSILLLPLAIFAGLVVMMGILYTIVGGILLCAEFSWPFWIGIVWMVVAIWIWLKLGMMYNFD